MFALPRKPVIAFMLGLGTVGSLILAVAVPTTPAHAIIVFDPSNYGQNILTAARTLTQINNQIRMLQNQAQGLINQAKNLSRIDFPELDALRQKMQQIDILMGEAQNIRFQVNGLDQQFRRLYPNDLNTALRTNDQVIAARTRLDAAMSAYQQTMTVQAQVVENVSADARTLESLVARSQGAEGALQVGQATNQLLALTAKQQFQIQNLMAAQYRVETMEAARRAQAETDARAAATRFLGTGHAYTPLP